ncbi:DUF2845 domain-containing protein [Pseudomonas pohangensis]|nr:DUF2845 domain-containing protein [Pseudomonas pohangensis]
MTLADLADEFAINSRINSRMFMALMFTRPDWAAGLVFSQRLPLQVVARLTILKSVAHYAERLTCILRACQTENKESPMKALHFLLPLAALLAATPSFAEDGTDTDLRCGTNLVETGAAKADVLSWCGEPTSKEGEQWVYNRGDTQPTIVVYFSADDTVGRITALPMD